MDVTLSIGTDVATICFFHPDDLTAYADAPMTWYAVSYSVAAEFERGRMIAFGTGNDGGYSVRVTDQGLSEREKQYAGASCEYRLSVTRGRLTIDNTDGLPSEEQQDDLNKTENGWFAIANGTYRATVTALRWEDEPGAVGDNGRSTPGSLNSYVLSLEPVSDLGQVSFPAMLPNVLPHETELTFTDFAEWVEPKEPTLESAPLHVVTTSNRLTAPGHRLTVPMMERPPRAVEFVNIIVANDHSPGSIGIYGRHHGFQKQDAGWDYEVDALALVRVIDVVPDDEWPLCDFEPLVVPTRPISDDLRARLLEAFGQHARAWHLPTADYQLPRLAQLSSDRAVTNTMIGMLALPPAQTASLLASDDRARAEALLAQLST